MIQGLDKENERGNINMNLEKELKEIRWTIEYRVSWIWKSQGQL